MVKENDVREMRREIERIKDRVDEIAHVQAQGLRVDGRYETHALEYFQGRAAISKAKILLAVNGLRSVSDVADHVGIAISNASTRLKEMEELGLVAHHTKSTGEKVYTHSTTAQAINLSRSVSRLVDDS